VTEIGSSSQPTEPANLFRPPDDTFENAFWGPNGLRAGWRLLIAYLIYRCALYGVDVARNLGLDKVPRGHAFSAFAPGPIFRDEMFIFLACLIASWVMAKIEGRRIADYGLPAKGFLGGRFWLGLLIGFASVSALMIGLHFSGAYHFGGFALHGRDAWRFGAAWGVAFIFVGFREEFYTRGYALFTATTGLGFWAAALLTSGWFLYLHSTNSGENLVGLCATAAVSVLFCIFILKTGDLWLPIGFHAAWDWGLTYFYGVPDSGLAPGGRLFNSTLSGPEWLSGGSDGPEASWLCLILIAVLCVATLLLFRKNKYPNPDAVPDPRHRKAEPAAKLSPEVPQES
jgi:membrane protease YdiL (CAAX protease family)